MGRGRVYIHYFEQLKEDGDECTIKYTTQQIVKNSFRYWREKNNIIWNIKTKLSWGFIKVTRVD